MATKSVGTVSFKRYNPDETLSETPDVISSASDRPNAQSDPSGVGHDQPTITGQKRVQGRHSNPDRAEGERGRPAVVDALMQHVHCSL